MAVVDYINEKTSSLPPELSYALQARDFQALPNQGGLRDQPVKLLNRMRIAYNVWRAVSEYSSAKNSAIWAQQNPSMWKVAAESLSLAQTYDGKKE